MKSYCSCKMRMSLKNCYSYYLRMSYCTKSLTMNSCLRNLSSLKNYCFYKNLTTSKSYLNSWMSRQDNQMPFLYHHS